MQSTVEEYVEDGDYFTVDLKQKFSKYDVKVDAVEKGKPCWKQFFVETYAN